MRTKAIRTLSLLLSLLLSAPLLGACGESSNSSEEPKTANAATDTAGNNPTAEETLPEEEPAYDPGIEQKDFGGRNFVIMDRSPDSSGWWVSMDVYAEELTGEPLNDAVYNRNETVNQYFNIRVSPYTIPDGNFVTTLRSSAAANDHIADLAMLTLATSVTSAKNSLLFDLNT